VVSVDPVVGGWYREGGVQDFPCFDFNLLDNAQPFGWMPAKDVFACTSKAGMGSTQRASLWLC